MDKKNLVYITTRLPLELHLKLKAKANADRRTLQGQFEICIEHYFAGLLDQNS